MISVDKLKNPAFSCEKTGPRSVHSYLLFANSCDWPDASYTTRWLAGHKFFVEQLKPFKRSLVGTQTMSASLFNLIMLTQAYIPVNASNTLSSLDLRNIPVAVSGRVRYS